LFDNFGLMVQAMLEGARVTVVVTLASYAIALAIGMILVVMHVSPAAPARWAAHAYTQLFRNVPLLAVLFIMYFGLPSIGIETTSWGVGLLGLGLYTGAFVGETLRSGINSIPLGQAEVALVKNSALVYAVGITELYATSRRLIEDNESRFDLWGVIIGVTVSYLLIAFIFSYLVRLAEKRAAFVR
jgi:glutamate transport system permease protein